MERENRISQSVLPADEQTFIRHLRSTKGPAFKNRQRLWLFIPAGNDYSTADRSRLSQRKYFIPKDDVAIAEGELNAARRRAMFVLASGGDPHRDIGLDSIAAERLADELDTAERRAQLAVALDELPASDLPALTAGVASLRADPELAWRSFALSLLADELADE